MSWIRKTPLNLGIRFYAHIFMNPTPDIKLTCDFGKDKEDDDDEEDQGGGDGDGGNGQQLPWESNL